MRNMVKYDEQTQTASASSFFFYAKQNDCVECGCFSISMYAIRPKNPKSPSATDPTKCRDSLLLKFNNKNVSNSNIMTISEAYKILNLNPSQKITKEDVNRAYIKIQKKIHPDISPETTRLSSIVNEAKEIVIKDLS